MENSYKISTQAVVFNYLIYILPIAFLVFELLLTETIPVGLLGAFFTNPVMLLYFLLTILLPSFLCMYASRKLSDYDGSPESCKMANKSVLIFTKMSILMSFTSMP